MLASKQYDAGTDPGSRFGWCLQPALAPIGQGKALDPFADIFNLLRCQGTAGPEPKRRFRFPGLFNLWFKGNVS